MTRVVHVSKVAGISGSENHLLLLLPALRGRGFDVRFVLLHEDEPGAREFARRLEASGVPVDAVHLPFAADPRAAARLVRILRRGRPEIVHTHLVHADLLGLPAAALARVPVRVSTKHGFNAFRSSRAFALADRSAARLARVQIAISAGLARYLAETEGFAEDAFEVVHYGVVPGPEPPPPPAEPRLLAVGRLIPIKGFDVLLRAFARARERVPALALEVAGDGPLAEDLRRAAPEGVTFLGRVDPIAPAYERAAAVVVPSLGEGFGMVALEAAERGRAVVASAVGGLPEIVDGSATGLLVAPRDEEQLARAMLELVSDPERAHAMGAAARRRAVEEFSQERCTERTVELYRAALFRSRA